MAGDAAAVAEARQAHGVDPRLSRGRPSRSSSTRERASTWIAMPGRCFRPTAFSSCRLRPTDGVAYSLAFTASELAAVFGEVRSTRSWDRARCYHFPKAPPAIASFRVPT
jgi:hypothetical protein